MKCTRAEPPGKPMASGLGPEAPIGFALLTQDAKVTPAANTAPTAAKREKLIRIEVLSSSVRERIAKRSFTTIFYPALFRSAGERPCPSGGLVRRRALARKRLQPLADGLQEMGRHSTVQDPVIEAQAQVDDVPDGDGVVDHPGPPDDGLGRDDGRLRRVDDRHRSDAAEGARVIHSDGAVRQVFERELARAG